jgi:hypothetical protein
MTEKNHDHLIRPDKNIFFKTIKQTLFKKLQARKYEQKLDKYDLKSYIWIFGGVQSMISMQALRSTASLPGLLSQIAAHVAHILGRRPTLLLVGLHPRRSSA